MAQFEIKDLCFTYPLNGRRALENINLKIESGEFITVCGRSGCGKTTLLRLLKSAIAPKGRIEGSVLYNGSAAGDIDLRTQAGEIGFVMQDPQTQAVTDKVWHELAFGLENLGLDNSTIRLRVAEMASYFGIGGWFDSRVDELSGGQLQMLNLASVMVMHPSVLILDEPTSQLDPISARSFIETVDKINKELGVTVILSEHRLEEVFPCSDRVIVMDGGRIISDSSVRELGATLGSQLEFVRLSVPSAMRIFNDCSGTGECPVTVREGRKWLSEQSIASKKCGHKSVSFGEKNAVEMKDVCFSYSRDGENVLNNLSLKIPEGSVFAVLGANGAGKSTLAKVMAGILKPHRGKITVHGKRMDKYKNGGLWQKNITMIPQDVRALFTAKTVAGELDKIGGDTAAVSRLMRIDHLAQSHPFDLSGGEQQRLALAEGLLTQPEILILDEPTKGMDGEFKTIFADVISRLRSEGKTVIMISHDIEFCASNAELCAMLFDGSIASFSQAHEFFNGNHFYTTAANRISRGIIEAAVTREDVSACVTGKSFQ
ncbi:MAG: ATP-binding cassette domain-containing protein [Clostridia bacterium]|nr:ATP-binding cassette domain-containing protein [Clostridia bacterium]